MIARLKEVSGSERVIRYSEYIKEVLYAPGLGYYAKDQLRVGRNRHADFYTNQSLGTLFGKLVAASAASLLGLARCSEYTFVEIGAEPAHGIFLDKESIFKDYKAIRLGDSWDIPARSILFANELFDAQPFHRLRFEGGDWVELGVKIHANGEITEEALAVLTPDINEYYEKLPKDVPEGYQVDYPYHANCLLKELVRLDWEGLLLIFDYGSRWDALAYDYPKGTARTYSRHKIGGNLLENPGEQDITCNICWDDFSTILREHGFNKVALETQEAFFVHHGTEVIEAIVSRGSGDLDRERQTLKELIHPSLMGDKFQVLWGIRET